MAKNKKTKKSRKQTPKQLTWRRLLPLMIFALLSFVVMAVSIVPPQVSYAEGEIAGEDVFNTGNTITFSSAIRTEEAHRQAADQVELQYRTDQAVSEVLLETIAFHFLLIEQLRAEIIVELTALDQAAWLFEGSNEQEPMVDYTPFIEELRNELPGTFADGLLYYLLSPNTPDLEINALNQTLHSVVADAYAFGVREGELEQLRQQVLADIEYIYHSGAATADDLFGALGKQFLDYYLANFRFMADTHYSAIDTTLAVEAAIDAVPMQQVTIQAGERIVTRGAPITAEQIEALQALGMYSETSGVLPYLGLLVLVMTLYIILGYYLLHYQERVFIKTRMIVLLGVIMVIVLLFCKVIFLIGRVSDGVAMSQVGYLSPVAAASMLIAVLLGRNLAVFVTVLLSVLVGVISNGNMQYALIALGGGLAGILSTANLNQRSQFVNASIYILLVNVLLIGAWGVIFNESYTRIGVGMLLGVVNGFIAAILAMGILPFLETAFRVTTEVKLLELSNSNHPLLKRLMVEAPGTYNHSVIVGNLAEAAADAIEADPLIVRVAAYYHDIGKLKRPYFFVENQSLGDNPHDKLQPALSSMIITSHVRDGIEMLKEEKFPEEIIDLVEQHHGSGLLQYFYHRAKEQAIDVDELREDDYRYPFSRPQTKEAGLLMLADSVQASVQALHNPVKGQIEETIQSIIKSKMDDGQLQECPLTFLDLNRISQSFMTVLSGVNHSRIVYPDQVAKEVGGNIDAHLLGYSAANNGGNTAAAALLVPGSSADNQSE